MSWREGSNGDYCICRLPVFAPARPEFNMRLDMTAHISREPKKCSFSLIMGDRIFALDVNPGRIHNNRAASVIVKTTHWQRWPNKEVDPDARDLFHVQWWNEFLMRANISFMGRYERPPYLPEQLEMI